MARTPEGGPIRHATNPVVINIEETLRFFDEIPDWSEKHATAIVAVLGEDLAAATLKHCLERNGAKHVQIRPETVKTPGRRGPWLDRWIEADLPDGRNVLFQTEVKSWSAHAIGGKVLKLDAPDTEIDNLKRQTWNGQWHSDKQTLKHSYTAKVLVRMTPPTDTENRTLLPMLIYWLVVDQRCTADAEVCAEDDHLFKIRKVAYDFPFRPPDSWDCSKPFEELWVFSVSSYLRFLRRKGCHELELPMPDAVGRLRALARLTKSPSE